MKDKQYTTAKELRELKALDGNCTQCKKHEAGVLCLECYLVYKLLWKK